MNAFELEERLVLLKESIEREASSLGLPKQRGKCRACGCTDRDGCPGGCWWVEPDICSRCYLAQLEARRRA